MKRYWTLALCVMALFVFARAANSAQVIQNGSKVTLLYSLEADGVALVKPDQMDEMILTEGQNTFPASFEKSLLGLKKGDRRTITLTPDQAYGPVKKELYRQLPKKGIPPGMNLQEGAFLKSKTGQSLRVLKILPDTVILDENHPLAGKTLVYRIEVKKIQ